MEKVPSKKWGPEQEISAATALCLCSLVMFSPFSVFLFCNNPHTEKASGPDKGPIKHREQEMSTKEISSQFFPFGSTSHLSFLPNSVCTTLQFKKLFPS